MSHGRPAAASLPEPSVIPTVGWHCSHLYYSFDRGALACLGEEGRRAGKEAMVAILDVENQHSPTRLQTSIVSGHKADFGLMAMDPESFED